MMKKKFTDPLRRKLLNFNKLMKNKLKQINQIQISLSFNNKTEDE